MANHSSAIAVNYDEDYGIAEVTATIDNGDFGTREIRLESGELARQANGSVTAFLDDETMLLATTTASRKPKEHLGDHLRVEGRGDLVEEQRYRAHHERPDDGDALLLPAGELAWPGARPVAESHAAKQGVGALLELLLVAAARELGREGEVVLDA